jgi:predicted Zn-dependent protease
LPQNSIVRSEKFRKLIESKGENPLLLFSYGQALLDEGKTEAGTAPLQKCAENDDDWMIPRILLGKAQLQLGNMDEGQKWLKSALQLAIEQKHEDPESEIRELLSEQ